MITLVEDKAQKEGKHLAKNRYWSENGVGVFRAPLPVGDYVLMNDKIKDVIDRKTARGIEPKKMDFLGTYNVCCDSKFAVSELVADVCGPQHARFRDECVLAQNNGIKLYILVENDPEVVYDKHGMYVANKTITSLKDLHSWVNPRLWIFYHGKQKYPKATKGLTLQKVCYTLQRKYGVEFVFCSSKDAGAKILEILLREKSHSMQ